MPVMPTPPAAARGGRRRPYRIFVRPATTKGAFGQVVVDLLFRRRRLPVHRKGPLRRLVQRHL